MELRDTMLSEIREIPYDFTYMQILRNKCPTKKETNRKNRLLGIENKAKIQPRGWNVTLLTRLHYVWIPLCRLETGTLCWLNEVSSHFKEVHMARNCGQHLGFSVGLLPDSHQKVGSSASESPRLQLSYWPS